MCLLSRWNATTWLKYTVAPPLLNVLGWISMRTRTRWAAVWMFWMLCSSTQLTDKSLKPRGLERLLPPCRCSTAQPLSFSQYFILLLAIPLYLPPSVSPSLPPANSSLIALQRAWATDAPSEHCLRWCMLLGFFFYLCHVSFPDLTPPPIPAFFFIFYKRYKAESGNGHQGGESEGNRRHSFQHKTHRK